MANLIREFIWNNKKSKISLRILQNPKKEGGLGLVDLRKKDIALEATWPEILSTEQQYTTMVYKIMRKSGIKEDILRCSSTPDEVKSIGIKSEFWEDVLFSCSHYNSTDDLG